MRKLSESLDDLPDEVPVLIKYKNKKGRQNILNISNQVDHGLSRHGAVAAVIPKHSILSLEEDGDIEYVERDEYMYKQGNFIPHGIRQVKGNTTIHFPKLTMGACSDPRSIRVAIIDDGLDVRHPDLACGDIDDVATRRCYGKTWIKQNAEWSKPHDLHGTHVAGE
jgi:Subtilase family